MSGATDQIMLCGSSISFQTGFLGKLLEISELGAERRSVTAEHAASSWAEVIYSCIKMLIPFTCTVAFQPSKNWKTMISAAPETITITWATPDGFDDGGTVAFTGAATRFTVRGATQERMIATCIITPSGEPTLEVATPTP